jgi:heme-degrading monooxygenase HmoA
MGRFKVREYEAWKEVFHENTPFRSGHGCTGHLVFHGIDDPDEVTVMLRFSSRDAAEGFRNDPRLRELMQRAGVVSEPVFSHVREDEDVDYVRTRAA